MTFPDPLTAVLLPLLIAIVATGAAVGVLHTALSHAMRARGLARWRIADTVLVSPLLWGGLLTGFWLLTHELAQAAGGAARGPAGAIELTQYLAAAAGAFVAAGFGARAVGKLY